MKFKSIEELKGATAQFTGTEGYHFHPLYPHMKYTDGVQFLGANGFGWLLEVIGVEISPKLKRDGKGFYCVVLDTLTTKKATISACVDISKKKLIEVVFSKKIGYTDAPAGRLKLYWQDEVLMIPSEY